MKYFLCLMLAAAATLPACTDAPYKMATPLQVPRPLYSKPFYAVGRGLGRESGPANRPARQVSLSDLLTQTHVPTPPRSPQLAPSTARRALVFYGLAMNSIYRRQYPGAEYLLRQSLALNPDSAKTCAALSRVMAIQQQSAASEKYLRAALVLAPGNPNLQLHRALANISAHHNHRALIHLLIARKSPLLAADSPLRPRIDFFLGVALQSLNYHRAAADAYLESRRLLRSPQVTFRFNYGDRRLGSSRGLLDFLIARNALLSARYHLAARHLSAAGRHGFTNPVIYGQMALAQQCLNHPRRAASAAVQYCALAAGSPASVMTLTDVYLAQGSADNFIIAADLLPAHSAGQYAALHCIAESQWFSGRWPGAYATFKRVVRRFPKRRQPVRSLLLLARGTHEIPQAMELITSELATGEMPAAVGETISIDFYGQRPPKARLADLAKRVQTHQCLTAALSSKDQKLQLAWQWRVLADMANLRDHRQLALQFAGLSHHAAPNLWPAVQVYAITLARAHHFAHADRLVRSAISRHLAGANAELTLARVLARADRIAAAIGTLQTAIRQYPYHKSLYAELENLYQLQNNDAAAVQVMQAQARRFPHDQRVAFGLLRLEFYIDDQTGFRSAEVGFLRAYPSGKRHAIVRILAGAVAGNWPSLKREIAAAQSQYPESRQIAIWCAAQCAAFNHVHMAIRIMRRQLKKHPDSAVLIDQFTQISDQAGMPGVPYVYLQHTYHSAYHSARLRSAYLRVLIKNHLWPQAQRIVSGWLVADPGNAAALRWQIAIDGGEHHNHRLLAIAKILAARPIAPMADLSRLASAYWRLKRRAAAMKVYEHMLAICPENAYANNNLGFEMLQHRQHMRGALAHISLAVHNYPNTPQYLDSYGWALYRLGFPARALPYLQRALILIGDNHCTVYRHAGDALAAVGDWQGAMVVWKAGVEILDHQGHLSARQQRLRARLERRIASEKLRESLLHNQNSHAM